MSEELRAIRAQEAIADEVYGSLNEVDDDVDSDWFGEALRALAPKPHRCVNCGIPHNRRNVRSDTLSAFCTDACHDRAMK